MKRKKKCAGRGRVDGGNGDRSFVEIEGIVGIVGSWISEKSMHRDTAMGYRERDSQIVSYRIVSYRIAIRVNCQGRTKSSASMRVLFGFVFCLASSPSFTHVFGLTFTGES